MRPITKGFIIGGIALMMFYLLILSGFYLIGSGGMTIIGDTVGVIEIQGAITSSRLVVEKLVSYRDNDRIGAIILRINSPGGSVGPTQEIFTEVRRTINVKPIVASLGGTCASGGYYIAAGCTRIVANPGTLTGSIGVIMEFFNAQGLFEWVGLRSKVVKSGEFKDAGHYGRSMTQKEERVIQEVVDNVHLQFVEAIALGRKMPVEKVQALADGRIFSGQQAMELNLVDELGNFQDAVRVAGELAGFESTPDVQWTKPKKPSYLDLLFENMGSRLAQGLIEGIEKSRDNLNY